MGHARGRVLSLCCVLISRSKLLCYFTVILLNNCTLHYTDSSVQLPILSGPCTISTPSIEIALFVNKNKTMMVM